MLAHCPNLKHPRIAILCNLARASGILLGTRIAGDLDFHVEPVRAGNLDMGLPLMMLPYTDVIGASFSATGEARGGSLDPGLNVSVPRHFPHIITSRSFRHYANICGGGRNCHVKREGNSSFASAVPAARCMMRSRKSLSRQLKIQTVDWCWDQTNPFS